MENVLIVSGSNKSAAAIGELIGTSGQHKITTVCSAGEAKRITNRQDFSLIVINTPLTDEMGADLAVQLTGSTLAGVIMLVKSDISGQISSKVEDFGVLVVDKPINRLLLSQAVRLTIATGKRIRGFKQESIKLKTQIDEMRLVERAKYVLMQYLKLSEPQAHRFIVKQAMDMRLTKAQVAENVLKTYES